jgi:hypothetical protein
LGQIQKNNFALPVPIFNSAKASGKAPPLPRIPPQIHHDLPPQNKPENANTPTKTTFTSSEFFLTKNAHLKKIYHLNFSPIQPIGEGRGRHAHPKVLSTRTQLDT